MADKKTMTIAFPRGGIIPASVLGIAKDRSCGAHEAVEVPVAYGEHLIHDKFAVKATPSEGKDADTKTGKAGKPAKSGKSVGTTSIDTLLGSNVLPSMVEISPEKSVQLGEIVALAHKTSGLSLEDWNAQADEEREAALVAAIEQLKADEAAGKD